jgi:hypothetical protein
MHSGTTYSMIIHSLSYTSKAVRNQTTRLLYLPLGQLRVTSGLLRQNHSVAATALPLLRLAWQRSSRCMAAMAACSWPPASQAASEEPHCFRASKRWAEFFVEGRGAPLTNAAAKPAGSQTVTWHEQALLAEPGVHAMGCLEGQAVSSGACAPIPIIPVVSWACTGCQAPPG